MKYIITSKPGMTPFAHARTMREARIQSRKARMLGLDGKIILDRRTKCN